jgi:anti-sigma factor RsiW
VITHVQDELPGLLLGELSADRVLEINQHLTTCEQCRADLVATAAATAALRLSARLIEPGLALPPLRLTPPVESAVTTTRPAGWHWSRARLAALAAAGLAALLALGAWLTVALHPAPTPAPAAPGVALVALGSTQASGEAHMVGSGADQQMVITVDGLPPPAPGTFYQVWLIGDQGTLPVGVLGPQGGQYVLPAQLVQGYSAIDVSIQPDNGNPTHSGNSILRGSLA